MPEPLQSPVNGVKVEGLEVPEIRQPFSSPLEYGIVLDAGKAPHLTKASAGAVMVGRVAGLKVIVRETGTRSRLQPSVAVQVSVTVPPQASELPVKVELFEIPAP